MVAQLHLALVMAIDARLLVLDEPTLGLDILYRKQFYDSLLNDYFDGSRTIVVTTHQVEEIQDVLTDLMFINHGRIVLECSMEEFDARYLGSDGESRASRAARALKPMHERRYSAAASCLFENVDREQLAALGEVRTPEHRRLVRRGAWATRRATPEWSGQMNTESTHDDRSQRSGTPIAGRGRSIGRCGASCGRTARSTSRRSSPPASSCSALALTAFSLPRLRTNALALEPTRQRAAIEMPYDMAAMMIMFTAFIVGIFYCLDALHGERRDRSILFWKSLPGFGSHHGSLEGCLFRWSSCRCSPL